MTSIFQKRQADPWRHLRSTDRWMTIAVTWFILAAFSIGILALTLSALDLD